MANQLKYIIMKTDEGREFPVIFGDLVSHRGMAEHVSHLYSREQDKLGIEGEAAPVSAGFLQLYECGEGGYTCYGESESLHMKSRGHVDDDVVKQWA